MSNFPNRRWLVIPATMVDQVDFNQVLESSAETLRYSLDGSKTFVKYEVRVVEETYTEEYINAETGEPGSYTVEAGVYGRPAIWSADLPEYDHEGILALLATEEWTNPNPQPLI
jgi:hypothetical protein